MAELPPLDLDALTAGAPTQLPPLDLDRLPRPSPKAELPPLDLDALTAGARPEATPTPQPQPIPAPTPGPTADLPGGVAPATWPQDVGKAALYGGAGIVEAALQAGNAAASLPAAAAGGISALSVLATTGNQKVAEEWANAYQPAPIEPQTPIGKAAQWGIEASFRAIGAVTGAVARANQDRTIRALTDLGVPHDTANTIASIDAAILDASGQLLLTPAAFKLVGKAGGKIADVGRIAREKLSPAPPAVGTDVPPPGAGGAPIGPSSPIGPTVQPGTPGSAILDPTTGKPLAFDPAAPPPETVRAEVGPTGSSVIDPATGKPIVFSGAPAEPLARVEAVPPPKPGGPEPPKPPPDAYSFEPGMEPPHFSAEELVPDRVRVQKSQPLRDVLANTRRAGRELGMLFSPTSFASDATMDRLVRAFGEHKEAVLFQDELLAKQVVPGRFKGGIEGYFDRILGGKKLLGTDSTGVKATDEFWQRLSTGAEQPTPELRAIAEHYRKSFDAVALGTSKFREQAYMENYFPGMWKDPLAAEQFFSSQPHPKRMEGSKANFQQKVFRQYREGIAAKLVPISDNPEVIRRAVIADRAQFNAANDIFNKAREAGELAWVPNGAPVPEGLAKLNDQLTKRFFPPGQVPVVVTSDTLRAIVREYQRTVTHQYETERPLTTETTTRTVAPEADSLATGKIEKQAREALEARGYGPGEVEQLLARLKTTTPGPATETLIKQTVERSTNTDTQTTQHFPSEVGLKGRVPTQQFTPIGEWVMPEVEARLLNNLFAVDSVRNFGGPYGMRAILWANARLNAMQLGFSAFHAQSEMFNAWGTKAGVGIAELVTGLRNANAGQIAHGVGQLARVPTAPLEYVWRGGKRWSPELALDPKGPLQSGMRLAKKQGMLEAGSAWDNYAKNVRQRRYLGVANPFNIAAAAIDLSMKPLFEYIIPRAKVGAFYDTLASEQIRLPFAKVETLARTVQASIDNRFGMVNYGNWFWHNNWKTAVQLMLRAPGWNIGFHREFGGAVYDLAHLENTPRVQYAMGLLFTQVSAAALYQYLHTGKGIESVEDVVRPRNGLKDPKTGEELRSTFANPLKDFGSAVAEGYGPYAVSVNVARTLANKSAPIWSVATDVVTNKDYYRQPIVDLQGSQLNQAAQLAERVLLSVQPFTLRQYSMVKGLSAERSAEALLGVTQAKTADVQLLKRQARKEIAAGQVSPTLQRLDQMGVFKKPGDRQRFVHRAEHPPVKTPTKR